MSASHANGDYFRVRFQEGYVFRLQARDIDELRELAANHFWWGDQKPPVSEVKLSLKVGRTTLKYGTLSKHLKDTEGAGC